MQFKTWQLADKAVTLPKLGDDVIARFTSVEGDVASLSTQLTNLNDIYSTDAETAAAVAGLMNQLTNLGTADTDLYNAINGLAAAQRTAIGLTNDNQLPDLSGNVYLNGATSVIGGLTSVADALAALHTTLALSNLNGKNLEISSASVSDWASRVFQTSANIDKIYGVIVEGQFYPASDVSTVVGGDSLPANQFAVPSISNDAQSVLTANGVSVLYTFTAA